MTGLVCSMCRPHRFLSYCSIPFHSSPRELQCVHIILRMEQFMKMLTISISASWDGSPSRIFRYWYFDYHLSSEIYWNGRIYDVQGADVELVIEMVKISRRGSDTVLEGTGADNAVSKSENGTKANCSANITIFAVVLLPNIEAN